MMRRRGCFVFGLTVNRNGKRRYSDGIRKHNVYIAQIVPKFYYIDSMRHFQDIQDDIFLCQEGEWTGRLRDGRCLFDGGKECRHCFHCIGKIEQKAPADLNVLETARLFEYKLYQGNFNRFARSVNDYFHKNGGQSEDIYYYMAENMADICKVSGFVRNRERDVEMPLSRMGTGMRCIYIFIAAGGLYVWREAAFMYHSYGRPGNISSSETSKGRRGDFISSVQDKSGHFYDPFAEYAV